MKECREVLDLLSQANQHKTRAMELEQRAKEIHTEKVLSTHGLSIGQVVILKDCRVKIKGIYSISCDWLVGTKLKKDGSESAFSKTIYNSDTILGVEEAK